jgi:predicted kinase
MKQIIALCGISGVGKTHRRTTDPKLKDLPFADVANVYREYPEIQSRLAFQIFLDNIEALMEAGNEQIVVEASFSQRQRDWLGYIAEKHDYEVEYIELEAPVEECIRRVKAQFESFKSEKHSREELETMERYTGARLRWLNDVLATA